MDRLQAMKIFERVVEEGGFAAAARAMDMSPPVVTRMVAELEQHLGTRLLQRTTRKLAFTDAGESYLQRVRAILHEIDDPEAAAAASTRDLRGTIRIVAAPVLATNFLAPMMAAWHAHYPKLMLDVSMDAYAASLEAACNQIISSLGVGAAQSFAGPHGSRSGRVVTHLGRY